MREHTFAWHSFKIRYGCEITDILGVVWFKEK